ncbi:50S ribosomal protein L35 [Candidatus Fermentibacterales bacterium]|nr:50S ribosomal protein L35 [Candidatus Fermentibacterales bacterium]
MPKMKTHKGAARRFKRTATGKIRCRHSHASHIKTSKSAKRKRNLRKPGLLSSQDARRVRKLLP